MAKSAGQIAYEEDVRRCPKYPDGGARVSWEHLSNFGRLTWENNPKPYEYKNQTKQEL